MEMQDAQIETVCKALCPNAMTDLEKIVFGINVPKGSAFKIVDFFYNSWLRLLFYLAIFFSEIYQLHPYESNLSFFTSC